MSRIAIPRAACATCEGPTSKAGAKFCSHLCYARFPKSKENRERLSKALTGKKHEQIRRARQVSPASIEKMRATKAASVRTLLPHPTDPALVLVPLSNGEFAVIDASDSRYAIGRSWYLAIARSGRPGGVFTQKGRVSLHRLITGAPDGTLVDHRDGDPLNNVRSNLRLCTNTENVRNQRKQDSSLFKGARWFKTKHRWLASIKVDGRAFCLGYFMTAEAAARAYDAAAVYFFGEFARPNFTDGVTLGPHRWQRPNGKRGTHDLVLGLA